MAQLGGANRTIVPFLDLAPSHAPLKDRLLAEISQLLDSGRFTNGPDVESFEVEFAQYCGAAACVGTASGLDALRFALLASALEPGAEVVVPANTFVATFEAVTQAGGVPVPADVSEVDYNIDPEAAEAAVGPRTHSLLPVHLYGQLADMRTISALAERKDIRLIEDACQAHGAEREGVRAGATGDAAAFSFYPGKNLGAAGDAGALVTNDLGVAATTRLLREHGQSAKYVHDIEGYTSRLDTIQALVLLHKLPHLDRWNAERRTIAESYVEQLSGVGDLRMPPVPAGSHPVWHLFVIRTERRDELEAHLATRGISTGRHYPVPAHLTAAYSRLGFGSGSFPVTEALARELLSLPIFPGMTDAQLRIVVDAVTDFFDG
jgi:dTDP-4-amino-4,6-dideoxygalactose transaminase